MRSIASNTLRVAALGMVLAPFAVAQAQSSLLKPSFMARLGVMYPLDSDVRDAASDYGFTVGLSYVLPTSPIFKSPVTRSTASIDLDYYRVNGNDNTLDALDLVYAERVQLGVPNPVGGLYLGAGIGISFAHIDATSTDTGGTGGSGGSGGSGGEYGAAQIGQNGFSERKTSFVVELMAGYMWSEKGTLEAYLRIAPEISGVQQNCLGLRAGIKF